MSRIQIHAALTSLALAVLVGSTSAGKLRVPADHSSIQAAIDAAVSGDEIIVAGGRYAESLRIESRMDLVLRGKGSVVLDLAGGPVNGVTVLNSRGIHLKNLVVRNVAYNGFNIHASQGVVVERCRSRDTGHFGFLVSTGSSAVTLSDCSVVNAVRDGIGVFSSSFVEVRDATIAGTIGACITLDALTTSSRVHGCRLDGQGFPAVLSIDGVGHEVRDNRVRLLGTGVGMQVLGGHHRVSGNRSSGTIYVTGNCHLLEQNQLRGPEAITLYVEDALGCRLVGNRLHRGRSAGLILMRSSGCAVSANRIDGSPGDGIYLSQSLNNAIRRNQVRGSGRYGIVLMSDCTGNSVLHNSARRSAGADLVDRAPPRTNSWLDNDAGSTESLP